MRCIRTHCTEQATAHQVSQLGIADAAAILSKGQAQAKVRTAEADVILAKGEAGAKVVIAEAEAVLAKGEAEAKVRGGRCTHSVQIHLREQNHSDLLEIWLSCGVEQGLRELSEHCVRIVAPLRSGARCPV